MKQFAVIGCPVEHSQSPELHQEFARHAGIKINYTKIHAETEQFAEKVSAFFQHGGSGINVTAPFKEHAFYLVDIASPRATQAKSVNTIWMDGNKYYGDTTDGEGLVRDIEQNHGQQIKDKRVLLLGAGGAASSALPDLMTKTPREICIVNRTFDKASKLAEHFKNEGTISANQIDAPKLTTPFDIIINATSAHFNNELPTIPSRAINTNTFCYDMNYGDNPTPFNQWCLTQGARHVADGTGMLREQARATFNLWHHGT